MRKMILPAIITMISILSSIVFGCFAPVASAGAVAAPVTAELIGELLVALGLMAGNATDGYIWQSDNPYVGSIFESQIADITNGVPVSADTLGSLSGTVIPDDLYTTDGTNYYAGGKQVTASDLYLRAKALVGTSYYMPVNVNGLLPGSWVYGSGTTMRGVFSFPSSAVGTDLYFTPYYTTAGFSSYVTSIAFNFVSGSTTDNAVVNGYRFLQYGSLELGDMGSQTTIPYNNYLNLIGNPAYPTNFGDLSIWTTTDKNVSKPSDSMRLGIWGQPGMYRVSGIDNYDRPKITGVSLLQMSGAPVTSMIGDSSALGGAVVKVEPAQDDDDQNTPPVPSSPNGWDLWRDVQDLITQISNGTVTNGGTDYQQFVNNNYNYVNVDVNVPDKIDTNINISGDVTIHEDISLPTGGDGSGFYSPDAVDAIAALTSNNPIVGLIAGLFSALDPALVGIFSVSVSLLLVLGLWKLIRG